MNGIKKDSGAPGIARFTKWAFVPTGDYGEDCATGRRLASEYLAFQNDPAFAPALGWVVQSVAALNRPLSGLEIGFFHELNRYLGEVHLPDPAPTLRVIKGGKS